VSDGDFQKETYPYIPCDIEALESTLIYLKVKVKGQPSPAKFQIDFRNFKEGDFRIFVSKTTSAPDESNHLKIFDNVNYQSNLTDLKILYWRKWNGEIFLIRLSLLFYFFNFWLFTHCSSNFQER
jgi:hypothetical protein